MLFGMLAQAICMLLQLILIFICQALIIRKQHFIQGFWFWVCLLCYIVYVYNGHHW